MRGSTRAPKIFRGQGGKQIQALTMTSALSAHGSSQQAGRRASATSSTRPGRDPGKEGAASSVQQRHELVTIADKEVRANSVRSLLDHDMRSTSMQRRIASAVVIAGLVTLAAWAAHRIVVDAASPSGLYWYHHHQDPYDPTPEVRWWISVIAVELITASWCLWRARRLAVTTTGLAIVFLLVCFPSVVIIVDAPRCVGDHLKFIALATAWLFLAAIALWTGHLVRYLRNRGKLRA